ncbi:hypothetical protein V9T40_014583 [Parthenolecanium corni]|uniref:Pinin/SDK/MemA protein domain-containing protein n=1 Tax=Parthenolecanium corni TaxID=536013 RepID=A0AAN9XYJ8_9HEMI
MDASTILLCKGRLEEQLQKAKQSLKGVDDNLKKFTSRNVSDVPLRTNFNKSPQVNDRIIWKSNRDENFSNNFRRRPAKVLGEDDVENIPIKKRLGPKVLHSSISGPPKRIDDYDDGPTKKPTLSSCVVAKPLVVPSRKEALSVRTYTETRARDRRMFGALLGTLKKFCQEETQLKDKEDKKAQVEKKLEEAAKREKEKIRLERQKLMDIRKQRESYIKAVENNMKLVKEQEQWEELQLPLFNYIRTESQPVICYLPKIHNEKTTKLLDECRSNLQKLIDEKRRSVKEEVDALISQWQNVDVEELMNTNVQMSPRNNVNDHNSPSHDNADKDETPAENSEPAENAAVTNGSWNTNAEEFSWRTEETTEQQFSAKGQRIRTKSSDAVSVKQEKEDDYEFKLGAKEEKNSAAVTTDTTDKNADDAVEPASEKSPIDEPPVESENVSSDNQPQEDADEVPPAAEN